jgi:glycosyltransferase involved in cell wall biosynthesis
MAMPSISVVIPTYNRPIFLEETLRSVWGQSVLPNEIIIGDDSSDNLTEELVLNELVNISPVPIRYYHHKPSLKEVKNVDFQYRQASFDLILHLHDDDPILPRCIELLLRPFAEDPELVASFGKQLVITHDGYSIDQADSINRAYWRTLKRAGKVDGLFAGVTSMFPNNSFLIRKDIALQVGYDDRGRAGLATDFYFGFRVGMLRKPMFFVPEFTALCRQTEGSQSRTSASDNSYRAVKIILEDFPSSAFTKEIDISVSNRMPMAIASAVAAGDKANAFRWLFSRFYRYKLFTLRGFKRFMLLVFA